MNAIMKRERPTIKSIDNCPELFNLKDPVQVFFSRIGKTDII